MTVQRCVLLNVEHLTFFKNSVKERYRRKLKYNIIGRTNELHWAT